MILCVIRDSLNVYCPGCGGTRAINELMKLKIINSLTYNPMPILFLIDFIIMGVSLVYERKETKYNQKNFRFNLNIYLLIFLVAYTVMRNVLFIFFGIDMLGDLS